MRILVLGGTRFLGRHIVLALRAAQHRVSVLTRGQSPDELPAEVERLRGDRDAGPDGLQALHDREWDVCIDVSGYCPAQVRPSGELLHQRVSRYVFVSAVSVYGDPTERPVAETHPRVLPLPETVTEIDRETYGRLKVTCEDLLQGLYGDRCTLLRPQIVIGPYDNWNRYSYWIQRTASGGEILVPGDGNDHLQMIDVRDIARFVVTVVERDLSGPFNLAGPRMTWAEFVSLLGVASPVWVPAHILRQAGVTEFELPLFREETGPRSGLMDVSHERATRNGLQLTDPRQTLADTRAALTGSPVELPLSGEREAALIALSCA